MTVNIPLLGRAHEVHHSLPAVLVLGTLASVRVTPKRVAFRIVELVKRQTLQTRIVAASRCGRGQEKCHQGS